MGRPGAGCGPRGPRGHRMPAGILAYTGEDVEILERRARLRSEPRGTMSRILNLRLRQRLLRLELRQAKRRLMVPDDRWSYEREFSPFLLSKITQSTDTRLIMRLCFIPLSAVHVEDSMDWQDPSFLEALESETFILQKRVEACKSHVILVTCFDSCPLQRRRHVDPPPGIRIT